MFTACKRETRVCQKKQKNISVDRLVVCVRSASIRILYLFVNFTHVGVPLVEEQEVLATLINAHKIGENSMKFYQKLRRVVKAGDKCSSLCGIRKRRKHHFSKIR